MFSLEPMKKGNFGLKGALSCAAILNVFDVLGISIPLYFHRTLDRGYVLFMTDWVGFLLKHSLQL